MSESSAKYLLSIYNLSDGGKPVKSITVSKDLNVTRSSVLRAVERLSNQGLVKKEFYGKTELTPKGVSIANNLNLRYNLFYNFFKEQLGVGDDSAKEDAIRCTCGLSKESEEKIFSVVCQTA